MFIAALQDAYFVNASMEFAVSVAASIFLWLLEWIVKRFVMISCQFNFTPALAKAISE